MSTINDEVKNALSLIESTNLPHPLGSLLESFVDEALNPVLAARYVKRRLLLGEASSLVADWCYIIESSDFNSLQSVMVTILMRNSQEWPSYTTA